MLAALWMDISTIIGQIAIKFGTNIHVPLRMNSNNFGDTLTFHLAPPAGQNLNLSNTYLLAR